jgi:hypothetical protein
MTVLETNLEPLALKAWAADDTAPPCACAVLLAMQVPARVSSTNSPEGEDTAIPPPPPAARLPLISLPSTKRETSL